MSAEDRTTDPQKLPPSPFSARQPWDDVSEGYAAEADWAMLPFSREAAQRVGVGEGDEVLDVAAGPGTLSLDIASRVRRVHAVDFSRPMIELLRTKAAALGSGKVTAEVGDGQRLGVADASFDVAFSMFGLMFFSDRDKGFAELFRALRPRGRVMVSSWAPVSQSTMMQAMFGALQAADPSRKPPEPNLSNLENPEVFRTELERAGFADVRVEAYRHDFRVESGSALWERMVRAGAPFVMLRKALGPELWAVQSAKAKAFLDERVGGNGPVTLSSTAWFGHGRRP